jgi:amino-acid N-acetyltransferase
MLLSNPIDPAAFVCWFREASPYIHAFRGQTFVIAFGGEVMADGKFGALTHDLNLLAALGVKLVLVHGARPQIEAGLAARGVDPLYVGGIRVTDEVALGCVKEANGHLRVQIEAALSMGLPNTPMAGATIRVASGNFVTARPLGVVDGVDLLWSGEVRKIDAEAILRRVDAGEIALLSPLGYSPTGEVFNLTMEDVARAAAISLCADKVIFLVDKTGVVGSAGKLERELTVEQAESLLQQRGLQPALRAAVQACRGGVVRAHLVSRHVDGALLLELFTHEGVGTMVTRGAVQSLRPATIQDVGAILRLIEPLEAEGALVKRPRELLEREIEYYSVLEHDRLIVACAALYPFPEDGVAELACLAVMPAYRNSGAADELLRHVEGEARKHGVKQLFALTTQAAHWFIEHGFVERPPEALPPKKRALYNHQRRSKVLVKPLQ